MPSPPGLARPYARPARSSPPCSGGSGPSRPPAGLVNRLNWGPVLAGKQRIWLAWFLPGPRTPQLAHLRQEGGEPLASWLNVQATGLSTGNCWATWASMRRPHARLVARSGGEPHRDDFALRLSICSPRPLQLVSNMEWIVDGVVASFQREDDPARAEAVARLIRPHLGQHQLTHDLVAAHCAAARLFAAAPFRLNASHTRCWINPADHQLVAGYVELTVLPRGEVSSGSELRG